MSDTLTQLFEGASRATQQNVVELLNRDAKGRKKYGCTLDRADLSTDEWLQHALEEVLDLAGYIRATKNSLSPDPNPRSGKPESNATELPTTTLSDFLLVLFRKADHKDIRKALMEAFTAEPILARIIGNTFASWEATSYMDRPDKLPADVMLRMVGSFDREQQRDLLKNGLEQVIAKKNKFKET